MNVDGGRRGGASCTPTRRPGFRRCCPPGIGPTDPGLSRPSDLRPRRRRRRRRRRDRGSPPAFCPSCRRDRRPSSPRVSGGGSHVEPEEEENEEEEDSPRPVPCLEREREREKRRAAKLRGARSHASSVRGDAGRESAGGARRFDVSTFRRFDERPPGTNFRPRKDVEPGAGIGSPERTDRGRRGDRASGRTDRPLLPAISRDGTAERAGGRARRREEGRTSRHRPLP